MSEMGSAGADSDFVTLRPGHVVGRYRIVSVLGQGDLASLIVPWTLNWDAKLRSRNICRPP